MKPIRFAIATLLLMTAVPAMAQQCQGLQDLNHSSGVLDNILQLIWKDKEQAECGSLTSVLGRVTNTRKVGGRKLEEDRPFNPQAAQADLAKAQSDPEVRSRLDKVRKEVSDPTLRMVYEAAILDEEGFYSARDLRINQIKQQVK
ncbi:hypothetical protein K9857_08965 [Pseudomonas sp. REP124]|uniref:hypothetical protein n=1 Tax=Pseudomonas sp. REP124 TaxID=2875731 RepID=UPI001CC91A47|nr:hypothetical protein [Pseudomonas sp. REP124]MBZ9781681.1 hypothetical protein [Pseudomonas sp. REP124]